MRREYDFKKLKSVRKPDWANRKTLKVIKTIRLDFDIVQWAVKESAKRGMAYQTFINSQLKEAMKRPEASEMREEIREIVREELKRVS